MIVLESLRKYFHRGGVNEVLALDRVNLTLQQGDFVTLIGSNGAGKSTLLNCVAGTHPQDSGRLLLDGTDIGPWPEHRRATRRTGRNGARSGRSALRHAPCRHSWAP